MKKISDIKIPFALALLAVMFTISPLLSRHGPVSYFIFGLPISLSFIYLILCSLLGASVYFYALGLVGENAVFRISSKAGHITYALALITPPLFSLLYAVSLVTPYIVKFTQSPTFSKATESALSVIIGIVASLITNYISKTFSQRDKAEKVSELDDQENQSLIRAKELFAKGFFDLAVIESWKVVEVSLGKAFVKRGERDSPKTMRSLLSQAVKRNILKNEQMDEITTILKIRNRAVHTGEHINKDEALSALSLFEKIIASMRGIEARGSDSCYFCSKAFQIEEFEIDDMIGACVCKDCAKKNPNWQDELWLMGQEP